MADTDRLVTMRAGSTGEDWITVEEDMEARWDAVALTVDGGLSRTRISLDRGEAKAVRDALTAFLGS